MSRIASVWFPAWRLDRLRRADPGAVPRISQLAANEGTLGHELPFALVERKSNDLRLIEVNDAAKAEGVHAGVSLSDARAALPALLTRPAERDKDRAALLALAQWCGRYGPRRNCEGENGIWIDIKGVEHLFGSEANLVEDLCRRLASLGLAVRVGVADTAVAAFAVARFAGYSKKPFALAAAGGTRRALAQLPIGALHIEPDAGLLLKRLGIHRIGQLYDIPREALAQRFRTIEDEYSQRRSRQASARRGAHWNSGRKEKTFRLAGEVLARLDQALGLHPEMLVSIEESPAHVIRRVFAEPLMTSEAIEAVVATLAFDLCQRLESEHRGGCRFDLCIFRTDGTFFRVSVGSSRAGRDPRHILDLLQLRLPSFDAGFGVDAISLSTVDTELLQPCQLQMSSGATKEPTRLMDRLAGRLGKMGVLRLESSSSHFPEQAVRYVPASSVAVASERPSAGEWLRQGQAPRPAFLLPEPVPIYVVAESPEGPLRQFTWNRMKRRVVRAAGPERIAPAWWRATDEQAHGKYMSCVRDYYVIEDVAGTRYWVFYASKCESSDDHEQQCWFLHGVF